MSRLAFSELLIDRADDPPGPPRAEDPLAEPSETRNPRRACSSRWTTAVSAAASIAVVSSPPSPVWSTGSRSARVGNSQHRLDLADRVAADVRATASQGEEQSEISFEEVGRLAAAPPPPRVGEDVLDLGGAEAGTRLPPRPRERVARLRPVGGVGDPVLAERVDEPGRRASSSGRRRRRAPRE